MPETAGFTLWFTGMSGAGKTTLANYMGARLKAIGVRTENLDDAEYCETLCKGLGQTREDRETHVRRMGLVAKLLTRNDCVAVVASTSPYRETREQLRREIGRFAEVFVDCPTETLMARDSKGHYRKALAGELPNFIGVTEPYEPPTHPEATVRTDLEPVEESASKVLQALVDGGFLSPDEVKAMVGKRLKPTPKKRARTARNGVAPKAHRQAKAKVAARAKPRPARRAVVRKAAKKSGRR